MDRLNTRNILRRKKQNIQDNNNCILCHQQREETAYHLFFACPFSRRCWEQLGIIWEYSVDFYAMMDRARAAFQHPFFMEIFTISAWHNWKQRNNFIFNGSQPSFEEWKNHCITEITLQGHRLKPPKQQDFLTLTHLYS